MSRSNSESLQLKNDVKTEKKKKKKMFIIKIQSSEHV